MLKADRLFWVAAEDLDYSVKIEPSNKQLN